MSKSRKKNLALRKQMTIPWFWIVGAAAILLFVVIGLVQIWNKTSNDTSLGKMGPRLAVNQEQLDLGRVPLGKTVRAEFQITNTGDRTLTLDASAPVRVLEGC